MSKKIREFNPNLAIQIDAEWFSESVDANYSNYRVKISLELTHYNS